MSLSITRVTSIEVKANVYTKSNTYLFDLHVFRQQVDTVRRVSHTITAQLAGERPNKVTGVLSNQQVVK